MRKMRRNEINALQRLKINIFGDIVSLKMTTKSKNQVEGLWEPYSNNIHSQGEFYRYSPKLSNLMSQYFITVTKSKQINELISENGCHICASTTLGAPANMSNFDKNNNQLMHMSYPYASWLNYMPTLNEWNINCTYYQGFQAFAVFFLFFEPLYGDMRFGQNFAKKQLTIHLTKFNNLQCNQMLKSNRSE